MATLITDSILKHGKICWTRRYLFVKITKDMVLLDTMRKIFLRKENVDKIHSRIMFYQTIRLLISWYINCENGLIFTDLLKPFLFPENLEIIY